MRSLASLIVQETKEAIYDKALALARALRLPVDSWQPGDPTRSLYHVESETLASLEAIVVGFIRSGFLESAAELAESSGERGWLEICAQQQYGVEVPPAQAATTDVVLTNAGGGVYEIAVGDLTFRNSSSGKTYRNSTAGTLASGPGTTLTLTVVAEELGSGSSAGVGEIDDLVTTLLGVTVTNPEVAVGVDEPPPATVVDQCHDKLSSFSPNGPKGAYSFVARDPVLAGTSAVARVREFPADGSGGITICLAGAAGALAEVDRALVEAAILQWATPLTATPTVLSATPVAVPVTYSLWAYASINKSVAIILEEVEAALEQMFATRPIGGDIIPPATTGTLSRSLIASTIRSLYSQAFRVDVAAPVADVALANTEVATLGAVTGTVTIVKDP